MSDAQNELCTRNRGRMNSIGRKLALAAGLLTVLSTTTFADPAPWFYWKNIVSNERICAQFPPEDSWVKDGGPYKDARCANRFR
jgi:hypothetical protein